MLSDPDRPVRLTVLRLPSSGVQHRVLSGGPRLTPKLEGRQGDGSPFRRHSVLFSSFPEMFDRVSAISESALLCRADATLGSTRESPPPLGLAVRAREAEDGGGA